MKSKYNLLLVVVAVMLILFSSCEHDVSTNNDPDLSINNIQNSATISSDKKTTQESEKTKKDNIARCEADGIVFNDCYTTLIKYPETLENEEFIVPDFITIIGSESFRGNKYLKKVILPQGITEIEWSAFQESLIEEINIPDSLEIIGDFAFYGCMNLNTVHANEIMIEKILDGRYCLMNTPFSEKYAKKKFIESGKQAKLDSYCTINKYDSSIQYKTNYSANTVNGGQVLDTDNYIYYITSYPWAIRKIDKQTLNSELILETYANKLYLYNDNIYYSGMSKNNNISGIYLLDDIQKKSNLILEGYIDSYVINSDVIYYAFYDQNTNNLSLYSYDINSQKRILLDKNLASSRDIDNILLFNNKIIYIINNKDQNEVLMQYNIDEKKSYEIINTSKSIEFLNGFTSAKIQSYNNDIYAQFNGCIYKATIKENICWEEIMPRLDENGYIYQLHVTDKYIFFFTNFFKLDSDTHYFHIFRMKHDGSEITKIYDSKEHNTDGGSTGCYAKMHIVEDKIFLLNENKTVLDFDGNILDWEL